MDKLMDKRCANCKHCIQNYPMRSLMCVDSEEAFFNECLHIALNENITTNSEEMNQCERLTRQLR